MSKNKGGPAFPCDRIPAGNSVITSDGMTLRDYFAATAMSGILSNRQYGRNEAEHISSVCYSFADAMLAERDL
jgi:hypothetical protein